MSYIVKGADDKPALYQGKEVHAFDYAGVVKGVDMNSRQLKIIGTDESRDRDGDIIKVAGWMLDNYRKNPVFLWSHDYRSVPLAAAIKVTRKKDANSLEFLFRFPTMGLYPFADMILSLYEQGIINASSVGFIPFKWEDLTPEEMQDASPMSQMFGGKKFTKQELLELSGCAVPSNPNALQNALKGFGEQVGIEPKSIADFLIKSGQDSPMAAFAPQSDDVLEEMKGEADFEDETEAKVHQVPDDIAPVEPETPEDSLVRCVEDFGVDLADGEDLTVLVYYKNEGGVLEITRTEVHDIKDLEPVDKVGAVLSRKNREKLTQARDALEEVLKEATDEPVEEPAVEALSNAGAETVNPQLFQPLVDGVKGLAQAVKNLDKTFSKV